MPNTIKRMKAQELKKLFEETIDEINSIENSIQSVNDNLESSNISKDEIDKLLVELKKSYDEIFVSDGDNESKYDQIINAYNEIIKGNDETYSLKKEIENLLEELEGKKKKIDEFDKKIFGYKKKKEDGTEEEIKGLFDNMNFLYNEQEAKFKVLYDKIEEELNAGATSVVLAKVFNDKVKEYKKSSFSLFCFFLIVIGVLIVMIYLKIPNLENNWENLLIYFILNLPFFALSIWLLVFIGNRRAEAKKLEEGYKHKEVMAQSFIGYKKSIEELDGEDKELLKQHMGNLLNTISQDTSSFLCNKGENHPFLDVFGNLFSKDNFPSGEIDMPGVGKVMFDNKK